MFTPLQIRMLNTLCNTLYYYNEVITSRQMAFRSTVYIWCTLLLMLFLRLDTDAKLTEDLLRHNAELLKDIKSYEIIKPYRIEGQKKRHASTRRVAGHLQDTTIVFPSRKKRFDLEISLNRGLFSPQFEERLDSNDPEFVYQIPHEHCFYHGTVQGEKNSDVSLSTCDGIEGVIRTDHGTFFIHPLKSQVGQVLDEHVLFNADDLYEQPSTCEHSSHKTPLEKEISHKSSTNFKRRVRRNVVNETKYVELFIINDREQYKKHGEKTGLRAKQLVNHLDSIYRLHQIRIALVKVETWSQRDLITVDKNASKAFDNFLKYIQNFEKDKGKHFDNVQLLTGMDFAGTAVGYATIKSICGKRSAGIVQDHSRQAAVTASTMAHQLGHNFGMIHDVPSCECPGRKCIMASLLRTAATRFSRCSLSVLRETLENGYGTCLFDEPKKLYGDAVCGNGFVEESEQCDCGTQKECDYFKNTCCNATTCMLHPGAACSHGECCENCQMSSKGKLCRKVHDDCDLPEYCTGDHEMCPEDYHVHDGVTCKKDEGYCYDGVCRSIKLQCQYLFGDDMRAGNDLCFGRNTGGSFFYGCYNETHGRFACLKRDMMCGKIHCLSNRSDHKPMKGQDRTHFYASYDIKTFCIVPVLTWGDGLDPTYVEDGTKCADGKMCMNSRCLPVNEAIPISADNQCPNNCSGNGICNNKGNCHCNSGYACPDCSEPGSYLGGSVDSGQGCEKVKTTAVTGSYKTPDEGTHGQTVEPNRNITKGNGDTSGKPKEIIKIVLPVVFGVILIIILLLCFIFRAKIFGRCRKPQIPYSPAETSEPSILYLKPFDA